MSMLDWAKREVEIACKKEAPDRKSGEWDYGCACYESALKAYESLTEDGHSGLSWSFTRSILTRLMNGKPLTPIEDVPEVWNDIYCSSRCLCEHYQCKRMSSLFKDVYDDGTIVYTDIDRAYCVNIDNENTSYYSRLAIDILDELYPITMPYYPPQKPFKIVADEFLSNSKNGDFDHVALLYLITPEGKRVELNKYVDLTSTDRVYISKEEWYKRKEKKL